MNKEKQIEAIIPTERDDYADFLKYILISLVVLGHFISLYQDSRGMGGVFNCIYSFHMPLFVFISGYFSKRLNSYRRKCIDTLLYPFILFQILNIAYSIIIPIEPLKGNLFYPYHQNWYLIALFWWRTFSPYKQFFKDKVVIITSVIISLSIGFFPEWNGFLGLYKTGYFLPFFILGCYCDDLTVLLNRLVQHKKFWIFIFVAFMLFILISSFNFELLDSINYGFCAREGYHGDYQKFLIRSASLVISFLVSCSVLVVTRLLYERYDTIINERITSGGGGQCYAS